GPRPVAGKTLAQGNLPEYLINKAQQALGFGQQLEVRRGRQGLVTIPASGSGSRGGRLQADPVDACHACLKQFAMQGGSFFLNGLRCTPCSSVFGRAQPSSFHLSSAPTQEAQALKSVAGRQLSHGGLRNPDSPNREHNALWTRFSQSLA